MDALSDILRVVRFTGGLFLEARFHGPWCVRSQVEAEDLAAGMDASGCMVAFHYVFEGEMEVGIDKEKPLRATPGSLILIANNDAHLLGSDVTLPPREAGPLVRKAGEKALARIDFGNEADPGCHFVCGFLSSTVRQHPLLGSLPRILVTDLVGRHSLQWAESSFRYAARECADGRPGSQDLIARLSELLFVEAVREYMDTLSEGATGWLAALRDPALARAMDAMHANPAHPWTADALANVACLSRSAFADRFVNTVGVPPIGYLTRWRMLLAGQRLRESSDTIAQIAEAVGYESESTFSRAFSREMGVAPGIWRKGM
jgi:AraC-like DNA-binding protein